jgi:hypothetical protein
MSKNSFGGSLTPIFNPGVAGRVYVSLRHFLVFASTFATLYTARAAEINQRFSRVQQVLASAGVLDSVAEHLRAELDAEKNKHQESVARAGSLSMQLQALEVESAGLRALQAKDVRYCEDEARNAARAASLCDEALGHAKVGLLFLSHNVRRLLCIICFFCFT